MEEVWWCPVDEEERVTLCVKLVLISSETKVLGDKLLHVERWICGVKHEIEKI